MKKTFTTIDVLAIVEELRESIIGFRVNQVYDIDHKTYMIKLQKPDQKVVLLLESAARIHTTEYEWPKSPAPSWFSMKLRKFLRNKRLENVKQLGVDRIVDLTFGSGEAEHHLIVELYDRGNIILTDGNYNILHVLRPRKEGEDTKIITNEIYPIENARKAREAPTFEELEQAYNNAKDNTGLKKIFNPLLDCGGSVLEHELLSVGFPSGAKKVKNVEINIKDIHEALTKAQSNVREERKELEKKGYIVKKLVKRMKEDGSSEDTFLYEEFHPRLYNQHKELPVEQFPSFNRACDEYFSKLEANELDKKVVQKEREALKKLENVRKDHEKRLQELKGKQEEDMRKGQLIELNQGLVDGALLVVRSAIANQIDWKHIQELLDEAQARNDPIACAIRALKLKQNSITLWLSDPYDCDENDMLLDSDEEREHGTESEKMRPMAVDINLDLSALANARRYYNMKRQAAKKEQKTIDASYKAIKSAEKKTQQTLKEVNTIANINKARKVHWFEKFLWFVSSDNYLVIGGRDSQQNEQVVKRHLKLKDIYVHADLHGASSVVIKNPSGNTVPPRTLHEAGIMALCYSRAWDEKVVTSAWWVWGQQVSKTAPAGEYLTTGAFMVRGKKNYLPPSHLVYGFGFLFRLEESSIARHEGERKARVLDGPDNEFSSAISAALEKLTANSDDITDDNEVIN
ncbi:Nuclear export mediator factor Nemf [Armadillidium nasatum]|uniref:Nuclear export mediator factor Nemf n=1 Tax=Armadillidium nasatum TaxID=96803 RepID=A0A5N5SP32_9CRUS|nr:Nuclear export mediator factor Nemf [Armadillidium nasatum]